MRKILLALIFSMLPLSFCYAQVQNSSLPTSSIGVFPKLPPSSFCTKEKMAGTWKLLMVYEVPSAGEIENYMTLPRQYYIFRSDGRYGVYLGVLQAITMAQIKNLAIDRQNVLKQYVVNKKGRVFFYRAGLAVDSLACFIVERNKAPFKKAQMLLMPPKNSSQGRRLLKVYQRMLLEHEVKYDEY